MNRNKAHRLKKLCAQLTTINYRRYALVLAVFKHMDGEDHDDGDDDDHGDDDGDDDGGDHDDDHDDDRDHDGDGDDLHGFGFGCK